MKIGQRVQTPHGIGTVAKKEHYGSQKKYQLGVKHDVFLKDIPRMYTDDILYYSPVEVTTP